MIELPIDDVNSISNDIGHPSTLWHQRLSYTSEEEYEDTSFKGEDSKAQGGKSRFLQTVCIWVVEESYFQQVKKDAQGWEVEVLYSSKWPSWLIVKLALHYFRVIVALGFTKFILECS